MNTVVWYVSKITLTKQAYIVDKFVVFLIFVLSSAGHTSVKNKTFCVMFRFRKNPFIIGREIDAPYTPSLLHLHALCPMGVHG